jgi:hypothetical protein
MTLNHLVMGSSPIFGLLKSNPPEKQKNSFFNFFLFLHFFPCRGEAPATLNACSALNVRSIFQPETVPACEKKKPENQSRSLFIRGLFFLFEIMGHENAKTRASINARKTEKQKTSTFEDQKQIAFKKRIFLLFWWI